MRNLLKLVLSLFAMFLFADMFLYYLDCDITNMLPHHNHMKIIALCLSLLSLYLMSQERKAGKK